MRLLALDHGTKRSGVLFGAVGLALLLYVSFRTHEPAVNGKPISFWIDPGRRGSSEAAEGVGSAYRAMDEECVRWLAKELEWKPNRIRDAVASVVNRVFGDVMLWATSGDCRCAAPVALGNLGERALPAVSALKNASRTTVEPGATKVRAAAKATLIRLGQEPLQTHVDLLRQASDYEAWNEGLDTLMWLGTNAAPAIPVFADIVLSQDDVHLRNRAAGLLGEMRISPEICVPVLVRVLGEPQMRYKALEALREFGPNAKSATDAVVSCLSDTNRYTRARALEALCAIDPKKANVLTNNPAR